MFVASVGSRRRRRRTLRSMPGALTRGEKRMSTGAVSLVETALRAGVEVCFAHPGTHRDAAGHVARPRSGNAGRAGILGGRLHRRRRRVGAHDGKTRHDAAAPRARFRQRHRQPTQRPARPPSVVNWIGDHATRHLPFDAQLTSDIAALTGSVGWTRRVKSAGEMAEASLASIEAALGPPGRVASLIIPADCQWESEPEPLSVTPTPAPREVPRWDPAWRQSTDLTACLSA
jgi:acetolactate synthase I/II/III large subunit